MLLLLLLPVAITIIVFTVLSFALCDSLRSFERENGFVFYDLIIMTAFDYKYYTA